jgi:hypothetical protein
MKEMWEPRKNVRAYDYNGINPTSKEIKLILFNRAIVAYVLAQEISTLW